MGSLWRRLRVWIGRTQFDGDLAEELELHHELKRRELIALGMEPERAGRESRRALGSLALALDRSRDVWTWRWLQDLELDVRLGTRLLRKHRLFACAAIAALSLGIGSTTTIFAFINTTLFKDL